MRKILWSGVVPGGRGLLHVARQRLAGRLPCRIHTHDFAEVCWVEAGQGVHEVNGQRLPLGPGTLVLIRPADAHGFRAPEGDGLQMVNVAFPAPVLAHLRARYFAGTRDYWWTAGARPWQATLDAARLAQLARAADHLATAGHPRLAIERFLLDLLDDLAKPVPPPPTAVPEWLQDALEQIQQPAHFLLGTRELARLAGRCPAHVTRLLQAHLGCTATDIVNHARLDHAATQLRMTPGKIVDIALACGFHNLGHFYHGFRRRFHLSPRAYRLHHQTTLR